MLRVKRAVMLIGATAATAGAAVGVRQAAKAAMEPVTDPRTTGGEFTPVPPRAEHTVHSADGTALHVREYGPAHAPTVVLVHGWTCSLDFWTPVLRALSADLRVVAYDLRGHGRSDAPGPAGFSTDALADDLAAVLAAHVTEGAPAVVAGHSMGGMSLFALAGRHRALLRQRVAAAVVASTGVSDLVGDRGIPAGPRVLREATASAGRVVLTFLLASTLPMGRRPSRASLPGVRFLAMSRSATPEQVAFCTHITMETSPHIRGGFGAMLAVMDLQVAVPHLDVPTVVIVGRADRMTPPRHSRRLAADLPSAELVQLHGVGHMTPVEAPDVIEKEIRRLVGEHTTPAVTEVPVRKPRSRRAAVTEDGPTVARSDARRAARKDARRVARKDAPTVARGDAPEVAPAEARSDAPRVASKSATAKKAAPRAATPKTSTPKTSTPGTPARKATPRKVTFKEAPGIDTPGAPEAGTS